MNELIMSLGCGIVFGIGAVVGLAVSCFALSLSTKEGRIEQLQHTKNCEKLLQKKVDVLWAINETLKNEK